MTDGTTEKIASETVTRFLVHGKIVSPGTNEIIDGTEVVHLEPKSMEVLVFLFDHVGEVVSRDEIQDRVWGDVTVGQESITNAIIKIRRAFDDDARKPQVIETIPKRGYRLVVPVEIAPTPEPPAGFRHITRPVHLGTAATALVIIVALAVAGLYFTLLPHSKQPDERTPSPMTSTGNATIAIAPFLNLGVDPDHEYLARGVEETIMTDLSRLPGLSVMRQSDDAGVKPDYVLEGSILRSGATIQITTRLVNAKSLIILSSLQFDRPFTELIDVVKDIRAAIIKKLAVSVDVAERSSRARGYTDSIEAYDLFLRAQQALLPRDRVSNTAARTLYLRAIEHDPHFARAYAGLSLTYAADYRNGWTGNGPEALTRALELAQTALEISPDMPEQHWVVGYVRTQQRRFEDAQAALKQAIAYDPAYADAFALLGGILTYTGEPGESVPLIRKAMRLRPSAGYLYYLLLGRAYYFLNDCEQAEINLREALTRNPSNLEVRIYHAACLVRQGQIDDAEWEAEEIASLEPDFSIAEWLSAYPMNADEQAARLSADLRRAGLR